MRQGGGSGNGFDVVELFGRMMLLPMAMFVVSLETFVRTLRQFPPIAESIPGMEPGNAPGAAATGGFERQTQGAGFPMAGTPPAPLHRKEENVMDTNLSDDMVKLVRYSVVNIERDNEDILHRDEQIVTDNMTDDAFAAWMIAKHTHLQASPGKEDPRKYLRVSYEVLKRWPRQDRKFEKRQLEVLGEIRDALNR